MLTCASELPESAAAFLPQAPELTVAAIVERKSMVMVGACMFLHVCACMHTCLHACTQTWVWWGACLLLACTSTCVGVYGTTLCSQHCLSVQYLKLLAPDSHTLHAL